MSRTTFAAAAVIAMVALGGLYFVQRGQPSVGGPGPTIGPSASPSQAAVVVPSATPTVLPTATPSPTPAPILWTPARLKEDWPAPVRTEPAGGAVVRPQTGPHLSATYADPLGDSGSATSPWVDIRELQGTYTRVVMDLVSNTPPVAPPTEQWIAYGVVVDDDRDGIPDRRFGIDNIPTTGPGSREHRAWITDLHTGRTVAAVGPPYGDVGGTYWDTFYPGEWTGLGARLGFGGDIAGGGTRGLRSPFYAWAAVIVDGQVVATDYAPDTGWLDPRPAADVEGSPSPSPQLENLPNVPGGRSWTVNVVNKSSKPATLFAAEEGEAGMTRPCGTVTPSVVPPDTTMKVTFLLPPKSVKSCWIWVNPVPGEGGSLFQTSDAPMTGEIRIMANGQGGWLGQ